MEFVEPATYRRPRIGERGDYGIAGISFRIVEKLSYLSKYCFDQLETSAGVAGIL
jgi:hypothetical protein